MVLLLASTANSQDGGGGSQGKDAATEKSFADLVKDSDIELDAGPAYGIVHTIDNLAEALAPKSNAVYVAYKAARAQAKKTGSVPPPKHILNAPTELMDPNLTSLEL